MFELEKATDNLDKSGTELNWEEDEETGNQICTVRLRHFISGRLIQVSFYKGTDRMG